MFTYSAYNIQIKSDIAFPELISDQEQSNQAKIPEIVIQLRKINDSEIENADGGNCYLGGLELNQFVVGKFLVEFGRKIVVEPVPGLPENVLRQGILGPLFSLLLRQRGLLVFHASCVAIDGEAVAFLGNSGWGKSTLANAFYKQGYPLLTDDVMAIQVNEGSNSNPITFPAYPFVKLLPDAAASLGYDFDKLAVINSGVTKRNNHLAERFAQAPLPLKQIYILENVAASGHKVEALSAQNALLEIIRHSRATNLLTTPEFVSAHLRQCTQLLKQVSISRLKRERSLAALPELVKLVESDLNNIHVSQKTHNLTSIR